MPCCFAAALLSTPQIKQLNTPPLALSRLPACVLVQVSVPSFRKQQQDVPDPLAAVPRRRPGQLIKAAMEAEAQQAWGQAPLPSGVVIAHVSGTKAAGDAGTTTGVAAASADDRLRGLQLFPNSQPVVSAAGACEVLSSSPEGLFRVQVVGIQTLAAAWTFHACAPLQAPGKCCFPCLLLPTPGPGNCLLLTAGRLIDEQEKQRCALLMQFKGSIPCPSAQLTPAGRAKVAAAQARSMVSTGPSGAAGRDAAVDRVAKQRAALQARFEEVEQEVAEREEFVASMQGLGRLQQEQLGAMRAEAAAKVQEMRQLDQQIRGLDAQLRQAYSSQE